MPSSKEWTKFELAFHRIRLTHRFTIDSLGEGVAYYSAEGTMPLSILSRGLRRAKFFFAGLAVALFATAASTSAAQGTTRIIASSGDPAPDGNGVLDSLQSSSPFFLNKNGQVAFSAFLRNAVGGSSNNLGVFRGTAMGLTQIARLGQAAPGGTGSFGSTMTVSGLNNVGQVSFISSLPGGGWGGSTDSGLFLGDGTNLQVIVRTGQAAPDANGVFSPSYLPIGINGSGRVAFSANLATTSGGVTDNTGVFLGNGMSLTQIAREGQASPDGNGVFSTFSTMSNASIGGVNDLGQVAFGASLTGTVGGAMDNSGIFLGSGPVVNQIARKGQAVPDGNGVFSTFAAFDSLGSPSTVNSSGQLVFSALLSGTAGGAADDSGIFFSNNGVLSQIAREGQLAPDGSGRFYAFRDASGLTNTGFAAFVADLVAPPGGGAGTRIFRTDGASLLQVARLGQVSPDGTGSFSAFHWDPVVSEAGQVAFQASLNGGGSGGVYFFDPSLGLVQVARTGDPLLGSTIQTILPTPIPGRGGSTNANIQVNLDENGIPMVAYGFRLADGRSGISLWSLVPEPGSLAIACVGAIAIALVTGWPPRSMRSASP